MKYAVTDNGPYGKDEWSKGWTVELQGEPGPGVKRPRLSDPEFDFTQLQDTVRELESAEPWCAWSLAGGYETPTEPPPTLVGVAGEPPVVEPETPVETTQIPTVQCGNKCWNLMPVACVRSCTSASYTKGGATACSTLKTGLQR